MPVLPPSWFVDEVTPQQTGVQRQVNRAGACHHFVARHGSHAVIICVAARAKSLTLCVFLVVGLLQSVPGSWISQTVAVLAWRSNRVFLLASYQLISLRAYIRIIVTGLLLLRLLGSRVFQSLLF